MLQLMKYWMRDICCVLRYIKHLPTLFIVGTGTTLITVSVLLIEIKMSIAIFLFLLGTTLVWHKQVVAWLTHAKRRETEQIYANISAIERLKDDPYFISRYGRGATVFESNRHGNYDAPVCPDMLVELGYGVAYLPQPKRMGKIDAFIDRLPPQKTIFGLAFVFGLVVFNMIMNYR